MASFLTNHLKRAIGNDDFAWPFSDVRVLLVADDDYDAIEVFTIDDLAADEATALAGYARQSITGRDLTDDVDLALTRWVSDDVVFPELGAPGDHVTGAWIFDYRFAADDQSFPLIWLDLRDEDGVGVPLTGADFTLHLDPAGIVRVRDYVAP